MPNTKEIAVGDIILMHGQIAMVMSTTERGSRNVHYKSKTSHKGYICRPDEAQVIGHGSVEAFNDSAGERGDAPHGVAWNGVEPGDMIKVSRARGTVIEAEFKGYNRRARKYPLTYFYEGQSWKASESSFIEKVGA